MTKILKSLIVVLLVLCFSFAFTSGNTYATTEGDITAGEDDAAEEGDSEDVLDDNTLFGIDISTSGDTGGITSALQIVIVLTVIALCPSILIMLTSFTRILVVMHFTRSALNTQSAPPNQILIGISLFLTFFVMSPVFENIYENAYVPLSNNEITQEEAFDAAITPLRDFMFKNVDDKDLDAMCEIAGLENVDDRSPYYSAYPKLYHQ